jgi:N,N'-diacetyllegionaminate synthase
MEKINLIAEIGVNHNSNKKLGKELIKQAKKIGASSVKFQTFKAKTLVSKNTPKVPYQKNNKKESHYEMLKKLELSEKDHLFYQNICKKLKIEFISTPYTLEDAKFLTTLKLKTIKTASADIVDHKLHHYLSSKKAKVIISTGMASIKEIDETLKIYKKNKKKNIILLHCVSNYPCSDKSLNLRNIITLKERYDYPIGFSDHSRDEKAAIIALSFGARVFERHFTINKNLNGPDHKASSDPKELKFYFNTLNRSLIMLGNYQKKLQEEEKDMKKISRKSLIYNRSLSAGTKINLKYLDCRRPGTGLLPNRISQINGRILKKTVKIDQFVKLSDFSLKK